MQIAFNTYAFRVNGPDSGPDDPIALLSMKREGIDGEGTLFVDGMISAHRLTTNIGIGVTPVMVEVRTGHTEAAMHHGYMVVDDSGIPLVLHGGAMHIWPTTDVCAAVITDMGLKGAPRAFSMVRILAEPPAPPPELVH